MTAAILRARLLAGRRCPTHTSLQLSATRASVPARHVSQFSPSSEPKPHVNWLTRKIDTSPTARKVFFTIMKGLGYDSPKQLAGRRAFVLYKHVCTVKADEDMHFWKDEAFMPPTFQSWFTITNLYIWMLTVRLRALPPEHGRFYIEALIDHFFLDVEDRIRAVLQPPMKPTAPYTPLCTFYTTPSPAISATATQSRAPDRIVTRQMKIFKEQWAGMGLSFDVALVKSDMDMAAAVWRNFLGARGAQGISLSPEFRRAVNLVGGEVVNVSKIDLEKEEQTDDGSGVHDFPPAEADKYVAYPELMLDVVGYVRRELQRLESISDEDIMTGDWNIVRFGHVKS